MTSLLVERTEVHSLDISSNKLCIDCVVSMFRGNNICKHAQFKSEKFPLRDRFVDPQFPYKLLFYLH